MLQCSNEWQEGKEQVTRRSGGLESRSNPFARLSPSYIILRHFATLVTMTALPQPNTATDKAFITTQIASLTRPLNSSVIPPALLLAHNTTLSQALRLKLSASAVRKTLEQLQGLREKETRKRERRAEKESQGRVVVSKLANKGSGGKGKERATWVDELPKTWPVREDRAEVDEDAAARCVERVDCCLERQTELTETRLRDVPTRCRYEQALRRVKALRKQRERTLQQLTHYRVSFALLD